MSKFVKTAARISTLTVLISSGGYALQEISYDNARTPYEIARSGASLAGGADFCNANDQDVDLFIAQTQGRISAFANTKEEAILARIEFINLLTAAKAKEPKDGCTEHLIQFNRALITK